ncbi:flagellar export chaperone FliS [Paenibacillus sp. Marseille-P2973]|uniref:flagellar export chaperone FliS n=1 Tax=Paenibacillus sp. Marseille-P2973 TaxID=1871032 RepID=UPI001B3915ED|nr:flagellar export chaperone FliS [Paenibacillus sp. Marseille-P2973]MBQ4900016.1 flagellar export chaperone FliS [Paenibacillus sp. Marseille-P2973]
MVYSPYQKYQQAQAQTASKPKLLIMLYEGAIRFTKAGIEGIESRHYDVANNNLCKAQAIIHELISSLNFDYEISGELLRLYEYFLHCLMQSNIQKNASLAKEVLGYLIEMRETWIEASRIAGVGTS